MPDLKKKTPRLEIQYTGVHVCLSVRLPACLEETPSQFLSECLWTTASSSASDVCSSDDVAREANSQRCNSNS